MHLLLEPVQVGKEVEVVPPVVGILAILPGHHPEPVVPEEGEQLVAT